MRQTDRASNKGLIRATASGAGPRLVGTCLVALNVSALVHIDYVEEAVSRSVLRWTHFASPLRLAADGVFWCGLGAFRCHAGCASAATAQMHRACAQRPCVRAHRHLR
jgi:hypothetical protein